MPMSRLCGGTLLIGRPSSVISPWVGGLEAGEHHQQSWSCRSPRARAASGTRRARWSRLRSFDDQRLAVVALLHVVEGDKCGITACTSHASSLLRALGSSPTCRDLNHNRLREANAAQAPAHRCGVEAKIAWFVPAPRRGPAVKSAALRPDAPSRKRREVAAVRRPSAAASCAPAAARQARCAQCACVFPGPRIYMEAGPAGEYDHLLFQ